MPFTTHVMEGSDEWTVKCRCGRRMVPAYLRATKQTLSEPEVFIERFWACEQCGSWWPADNSWAPILSTPICSRTNDLGHGDVTNTAH